jgi:hypothetical protein
VNDPNQWRNSTRSRPPIPQSNSQGPGSWVVPVTWCLKDDRTRYHSIYPLLSQRKLESICPAVAALPSFLIFMNCICCASSLHPTTIALHPNHPTLIWSSSHPHLSPLRYDRGIPSLTLTPSASNRSCYHVDGRFPSPFALPYWTPLDPLFSTLITLVITTHHLSFSSTSFLPSRFGRLHSPSPL